MEYFGVKVKSLREDRGLSQAELASRLDVALGTVSAYEQGRTLPSVTVLIKLCNTFGVSSDYLLGLSEGMIKRDSLLTAGQAEAVRDLIQALEKDNTLQS